MRLFLADGTPGGSLTAEIMNWTGHVMAAPRSDLAPLLQRSEIVRTGIYLLLGDDPETPGGQLAYIGEADDVRVRLVQHARSDDHRGKDFWDRVIVLTSKDANLTKAHVRYLESRFIRIATEARRATLTNGTAPPEINLPEADVSDMEYFIEQARIVLPVLGVNLLRSTSVRAITQSQVPSSRAAASPEFVLTTRDGVVNATAQEVDGEFVVRAGSRARGAWTGTGPETSYLKLRTQLEMDGSLLPTDGGGATYFPQDHVFASPSAGSAVILGRNSNGRLEWKVRGTKTSFGDWQASLLEGTAGEHADG